MSFYERLEQFDNNTAIIGTNSNTISYRTLAEDADRIVALIPARSFVFLLSRNHPVCIAAYLGFLRRKIVPLLINDEISEELFQHLLEVYSPEYVFLSEMRKELLPDHFKPVDHFENHELYRNNKGIRPQLYDDLALLLTTSGSTGSPKLVRLSYRNIQSNAESIAEYLEIIKEDRAITTMPMSYTYGLSIINSHLIKGASIIASELSFVERKFWDIVKNLQPTTFGGVPYIYEILKKLRFKQMSLPSLRYITQAGGKLSQELVEEFRDICNEKGIRFIVMYGQTEATARMSYLPWKNSFEKSGSIGIAIPGGKFWLENENGKIIETKETTGELIYQGENVSLGYAESPNDFSKDDENFGILRTGDISYRDADDFYYIVGRKKRFIKIFGNRISLDETESLLQLHFSDTNIACGGVDDKMYIFIINELLKDNVLKFLAERTGLNIVAFKVVAIPTIPKNESGKTIYTILNKYYE
jgi:acyl-CoA synthetase (AMP-forming)/AMP-acid ligase II